MDSYEKELNLHVMNKVPSFEGWYFRFVEDAFSIAVIVGIAITKEKQEAFIQVFHTLGNIVEKISYDLTDFKYKENPFEIRIKDSILTKHYICIKDKRLSILIDINFSNAKHLKKTRYAPTIMGPFAYLNHMECNHAIINLESEAYGVINYKESRYSVNGTVYQEKDWGTSFPSKYIWIQSSRCIEKKGILFLSCAMIPLKIFSFTGIIMTLILEEKEYFFASYYGATLKEARRDNNGYRLRMKQGKYLIDCYIEMKDTFVLDAPHNGMMIRNVEECLLGKVHIALYQSKQCIEKMTFDYCGIENDHFFQ